MVEILTLYGTVGVFVLRSFSLKILFSFPPLCCVSFQQSLVNRVCLLWSGKTKDQVAVALRFCVIVVWELLLQNTELRPKYLDTVF